MPVLPMIVRLLVAVLLFPAEIAAFRSLPRWSGPLAPLKPLVAPSNPLGIRSKDTALFGIPKLFRWLVDLYPLVLESVGDGLSNNAMSVDNFYLDMNGIIHTCTHSNNDKLIPLQEQEMFLRIFAYTDQLYKLVNPKKTMFLAVDGVAPRAKMNQQRSRRFRSSKEREALIAEHLAKEGRMPDDESFDSNCITPGTTFMHRLSLAFRKWIEYKMKTDKFWQNGAEVIFSGPDVPGEGEHKVMDLIREEQAKRPGSNERHCLYGLDADLIMLSLVTHEPHFVLLREKVLTRQQQQRGRKKSVLEYTEQDFECLEITLLRKMFQQHFRKLDTELEKRALAPSLGGVLDQKGPGANSASTGQASTPSSTKVKHASTPAHHRHPSSSADEIATDDKKPKRVSWTTGFDLERVIDDFVFMCFFVGNDFLPCLPHMDIADGSLNLMMNTYRDILPGLGGYLTRKNELQLPRVELFLQELARREPLYFEQRAADEQEPAFAGPRYRDHYYETKFGIKPGDEASIREIVKSYLEGLYWVLTYYHRGCGSWTWFYPHLYAPLASDLVNLASIDVTFERGRPFTPLLQLLSVLPPQSGAFLPPAYESIMSDPLSPMVDYYPQDFEVDLNGKQNAWECVVRIPFINETTLVQEVSKIDHQTALSAAERDRNAMGVMHRFHPKQPGGPTHSEAPGGASGGHPDAITRSTVAAGAGRAWGNALVEPKRGRPPSSGADKGARHRQR